MPIADNSFFDLVSCYLGIRTTFPSRVVARHRKCQDVPTGISDRWVAIYANESIVAARSKSAIDQMPNLRSVVAMGRDASRALAAPGPYHEITSRGLAYHEVSHPSRAMTDADPYDEWRPVFAE
jgi:hypothetical protein